MLRVLLVDDEDLPIVELKYLLEKFDNIEICGEAQSGKKAIELAKELLPDVIFLDIKMHDMNGFQIAEDLMNMERQPKIIFITAYDEYAIKAFEINAVDYILKPFSEERIRKTVERIFELFNNDEGSKQHIKREIANTGQNRMALNKIPVEKNSRLILINIEDILFVEADGRNTIIRTEKETYKTNFSLKQMEERLKPLLFFRPHRSYLINMKKIKEIVPWFNSTYKIIMTGYPDIEIPVTRNNTKIFKDIIGI
ncbi:MAG: response regulator transcription factor [Firmicutes bacterium]|jgi:DNA-binding LytR/AlgR family response regulator|nr:response regulator transcription factor [Bacillota bacterium]